MRIMFHILYYDLFICKLVNAFVFPIAYWIKPKSGVLWFFLHDGSMYGDSTFHPKMKDGFIKAWLWAMRNPLHNYYYKDVQEGKEMNFKGTATVKYGTDKTSWRTFTCSDTGDNNGKILDFDKSKFGTQDITFDRNTQKCFRKSYCKPFHYWLWLIVVRIRTGHERGLMQSQFNFTIFWMNNKTNYMNWKKLKWVTI